MLAESRIGMKPLAALCRRLAISLSAGVDVRTVWAREATNARGSARKRFSHISEAVAEGSSVCDALPATGNFFPEFFRELVRVGEETGQLPEIFRRLAEHYEHQLKLRRSFISAITWPLIELALSLSVIGLLIWVMGLPQLRASGVDLLGFGLSGTSGLIKYLGVLSVIAVAGWIVFRATTRGLLWVAPVQRAIMRIPRLGRALETMAMARLAWALHVTLNTGMDLRAALKMSLGSTHNALYTQHIPAVLADIGAGREIYEALADTGAFPLDFLDAVQVGEESGQLVESMGHLSVQYQDESRIAMNTLTILMGVAVSMLIGGIIIFFIFRIAGFYIHTIEDAANMRH